MKKPLSAITSVLLFFVQAAFANPCSVSEGDAAITKAGGFAIEFKGPKNGFWSYGTANAADWRFKIVDAKNLLKSPKIVRFGGIFDIGEKSHFINFEKDLKFVSPNEFSLSEAKVKEMMAKQEEVIADFRKKKPISIPDVRFQVARFTMEFNGDAEYDDLYHECYIGFGFNEMKGRLSGSDSKPEKTVKQIEFNLNSPGIETGSFLVVPKHFTVPVSKGEFVVKGLPISTLIASIEVPDQTQMLVTYFSSYPKTCEADLRRETAGKNIWRVTANSCSSPESRR